jgi:peptidoglycan hydrolase-like protein with peptidoglycan-binding domain
MPIPQVQVTLLLLVLQQNGDPVPSDEVRCLQFMLAFTSGRYSPFERALRPSDGVDGLFGPKTYEWVRQFQANENLAVDGVVGTNTWTALLDRWTTFQKVG